MAERHPYKKPDHFTREAKAAGFAARSVFKLEEIHSRYRLLRPGQRVLDLGCSPGSWAQFALTVLGPSGRVVGVDIVQPSASGFHFVEESVLTVTEDVLRAALGGPADVVLSDMAPLTSGVRDADHWSQIELATRALDIAKSIGRPGSCFVCKVFDGGDAPAFFQAVRGCFADVKRVRPDAVRSVSREFFVVATGLRG